jgi:hypothetical protein
MRGEGEQEGEGGGRIPVYDGSPIHLDLLYGDVVATDSAG